MYRRDNLKTAGAGVNFLSSCCIVFRKLVQEWDVKLKKIKIIIKKMIRMQIGVNSQLYLGTIFYKSIPAEVFIEKGILKICRKFTGEHLRQSVISIKLESIFIGITLRHGCTPINLLHISDHLFYRTPPNDCF